MLSLHAVVGCVRVIRTCELGSIACWASLWWSDPADQRWECCWLGHWQGFQSAEEGGARTYHDGCERPVSAVIAVLIQQLAVYALVLHNFCGSFLLWKVYRQRHCNRIVLIADGFLFTSCTCMHAFIHVWSYTNSWWTQCLTNHLQKFHQIYKVRYSQGPR